GVLPDAAERRRLRASTNSAARDHRAIHDTAAAFRRDADAGLGGADRRRVERTLFFGAQLWAYRIHGDFDLDRSRPATFCGAADESRASDAGEYEDSEGATGAARCGDPGAGIGDSGVGEIKRF